MMRAALVVGLAVAACSEPQARRPDVQASPPAPVVALDAAVDGPPPAVPEGWVWAEGTGWRGAFPTSLTYLDVGPAPAGLVELKVGVAVVEGVGGITLTLTTWPTATQLADRAQFERNFMGGFEAQITMPVSAPVKGQYRSRTEVCSTTRYQGRHSSGHDVDMLAVVCTGTGFVLAWMGSPSRLDETLALFSFAPAERSRP